MSGIYEIHDLDGIRQHAHAAADGRAARRTGRVALDTPRDSSASHVPARQAGRIGRPALPCADAEDDAPCCVRVGRPPKTKIVRWVVSSIDRARSSCEIERVNEPHIPEDR